MLRMTADVRDHMLAHAIRSLPNEGCGMFSTKHDSEIIDVFHPMANAAASAEIFSLEGQEMLDLERTVEQADRSLVGVMHSHTTSSAYPSPTDVADIGRFDPFATFHHVIVSLRHAEPGLRSFRVASGQVTEEPVLIDDGEPNVHDESGAAAAVMRLPARPTPDG